MEGKKKLNKEQIQAVKYKKGPLLIIAGAGTGKTTVITERIKYLIEKELATPSEILALTFTEKASREMEERVDVAMPYGYTQMWISTFHSFCDRVLRAEALHIGLDPKFKLMTSAETIQFVRRNLFKFELNYFRPLGNPTKFINGMLQHFSRLQDEDVTPRDYVKWVEKRIKDSDTEGAEKKLSALRNKNTEGTEEELRALKGSRKKVRTSHSAKSSRDDSADLKSLSAESKTDLEKWNELASAYKKYEEMKVKDGVMDYGDLIVKTLELFRKRPNILKNYQKQFKYVLVDEFQDTNVAQYELLKLLAPPAKNGNLTVVGDDSQSVYKFRGAAVSNILYFKIDYKRAKTIVLTKNYRSTQTILDHAYKLIQNNNPDTLESKLGIDKNLISVKNPKGGREISFIHQKRVENEAEEVAKEIVNLTKVGKKQKDQYEYKDIAVLVRANNHAEPFIRAFQRHSIPYQFLGPGRLFRQPEIVDLISYLKVLYDFTDSVSFYRLLCLDFFDIDAKDLIRIGNYARRYNTSLYEACEVVNDPSARDSTELTRTSSGQVIYVKQDTTEKVKKLLKVMEKHFKLVKKETAGQLLYYFLQDTGMLQKLLNPDTVEAEKKAMNISKFFDKLKTYEVDHEDASVTAVVDWIDLSSELGESPLAADIDWTKENAVNILTTHSAKGLEFPVVFLVNLVSQRFPTNQRREQIPIPDELIKEVLPQGDYHMQEERRLFYVGMTRAMDELYFTAADYYGEGKREKKLSPFIFEALGDDAISSELPEEKGQQLSFLDYEPKAKSFEILTKEGELVGSRLPFHVDYLSYSQIQTFQTCPLHYKLRYIFKVPTPTSASQSFGTSIHESLKKFYESVKEGEKPTNKLMYKLLENNWRKEGFTSKSHEKKFFEKGKFYLSGFLKESFDPKVIPEALEQKFTLPLPYKKGERPLKIGGVMDRVDILAGNKLEIVDYKTGATIPTQGQVDKDLQLTFYILAATSIRENPFDKLPEEVSASLYFLDVQEKFTTKRTKKQIEEAVDDIYKIRREIEESDFKCSGSIICEKCEFALFCREDQ